LRDWQNLTAKERQRSQKNWNLFEVNQRLHDCPFFSSAALIELVAGLEKAKNLAGKCPSPDSDAL